MNDYRQEVETKEQTDQLFRKILEGRIEGDDVELMVTFSPEFQMKIDMFTTVPLYAENNRRTCFGAPWFSVIGQEEAYKVWRRV